jgi:hypothetical protein
MRKRTARLISKVENGTRVMLDQDALAPHVI